MRSLLQQLQRHPVELMRNHTQDQRVRSLQFSGAATHLSSRLRFLPRIQTVTVFRFLTPKLLRNGAGPHRLCSRPQTFTSVPPLASLWPRWLPGPCPLPNPIRAAHLPATVKPPRAGGCPVLS